MNKFEGRFKYYGQDYSILPGHGLCILVDRRTGYECFIRASDLLEAHDLLASLPKACVSIVKEEVERQKRRAERRCKEQDKNNETTEDSESGDVNHDKYDGDATNTDANQSRIFNNDINNKSDTDT